MLFRSHPAIAEVAVVGVPDPLWGEVGVAVCVPRDGATIDEATFVAEIAAEIPRYKLPRRFVFWDALPRSGYGKIPKRMVRDELEARGVLAEMAASARATKVTS